MMRLRHAAALVSALLCLAPAAAAQAPSDVPLAPVSGKRVPFTIALPQGWEIEREDDLLWVSGPEARVNVVAGDLVEDDTQGLPEAAARRLMTAMMTSEEMLYMLLDEGTQTLDSVADLTRKIETLGGRRAAVVRGRYVQEGETGRFEMRLTVDDGYLYMLMFMVAGDGYAAYEPLFARIRGSLVLGPAARPAAPGGGRR